jgi:hypothetical protein
MVVDLTNSGSSRVRLRDLLEPRPPKNGAQPVAAAGWPNYTASGWIIAQAVASADYAMSGGFVYQ